MSKNTIKKNKGSLTVEVLIVASIMATSFLAITTVAQKSIQVSRQSLHILQASFLLEEGAEAVRSVRDDLWTNISSLLTTTTYYLNFNTTSSKWGLSTTANTSGIFTREVTIAPVYRDNTSYNILASQCNPTTTCFLDSETKLIKITASWPEGGNPLPIKKEVSFYLAKIF